MKPGHDGTACLLEDGELKFSFEAEKDSFPRYSAITPSSITRALQACSKIPDVWCISGWMNGWHPDEQPIGAGYSGLEIIKESTSRILGKDIKSFSSTHERAHILCAYGMSPFPQGTPCFVLVWEGHFGNLYYVDEKVNIHFCERILDCPGNRYFFLYAIAEPTHPSEIGQFRFEYAGKLMALSAFSDRQPPSREEAEIIEFLLSQDDLLLTTSMNDMKWSPFLDIGVESKEFKNLAGKFSDALFNRFYERVSVHASPSHPLLISGGCGLNCEWNTRWKDSGLFSSVFVPPCPNDSGAAIGTAIDAQLHLTGIAKIQWNVYSGAGFEDDLFTTDGYRCEPFSAERTASYLEKGAVFGVLNGRAELGPRSLGNRSVIAAPFDLSTRDRLNHIKMRENFRPIAPISLLEGASDHFEIYEPSPHMLYFHRVVNKSLKAVTHIDGTARVQTVTKQENCFMYNILKAFRDKTGCGVLCNTSFNTKNRGFVNRVSDALLLCKQQDLDGLVLPDRLIIRENIPQPLL